MAEDVSLTIRLEGLEEAGDDARGALAGAPDSPTGTALPEGAVSVVEASAATRRSRSQ